MPTRTSPLQHESIMLALIGAMIAPTTRADDLAPPPSHEVSIGIDSGVVSHTGAGVGAEVVYTTAIDLAEAQWLRLDLRGTVLGGDPARGDHAVLRLTSLEDGGIQVLSAETLSHWGESSAYFNGGLVTLELLAFPGSGESRLFIPRVWVGDPPGFGARSICGSTDDRALSNDVRACRVMPMGCSGWLINDAGHQFLTAGHCLVGVGTVCQFNVPLSGPDGSTRNPPPEDQYPIEPTSPQGVNGGVGNDYSYFGCWPNSTTNLTAFSRQGASFELAPAIAPSNGRPIRITGYGTTSSPVIPQWNQAQKTHTGPMASFTGSTLTYATDTTGGNSGSPVIDVGTGQAIGIHTHGGCSAGGGANLGTSVLNAGLQSALANPRGICNPAFGAIVPPIYVAGDANRFFGTLNSSSGAFGRVSALPFQPAGMAFDSGRRVFWVSSSDRLLYTLDPDTGIATVVGLISGTNTDVNGLAFDSASSTLYGFVQSSGQLLGINTATGVATPIGAPTGGNVGALDFDAMRGVIVGIDDAPGGSRLVRFNPLSGIKTTIGILGAGITDCNALAFNPSDGQLYTLNASTDQLLRVNPITGSASALGPTGMFFGSTFAMGCTTPCAADFDSDGTLDFFDYDAFLRCFEIGDCPEGPPPRSADFDGDGSIDFFDYDEFVRLFEAGC